jgi:ribulose 1,5-bisphosphate synthetase/thiazole synthase
MEVNFDVDMIVVGAGPARVLAAETWPARPATDIGVRYATENPLII